MPILVLYKNSGNKNRIGPSPTPRWDKNKKWTDRNYDHQAGQSRTTDQSTANREPTQDWESYYLIEWDECSISQKPEKSGKSAVWSWSGLWMLKGKTRFKEIATNVGKNCRIWVLF